MKNKPAILLLKFVPVVGAICCASNSTLSYYGIDATFMGYVFYCFILVTWLALAKLFHFCSFYYVMLAYLITTDIINIIDYTYGIPLSDKGYFVLQCGVFGFYLLFYTVLHVRDTRNLKKSLGINA